MLNPLTIFKLLAITCIAAMLAPCDTLTITMGGTGNGYWANQFFTNAAFQFTFFIPDTANVAKAPCCAGVWTTSRGTSGTVTVANVGAGQMDANGDQAVFVNQSASAAGIWHYNSSEFLTVSGPGLSGYDLTGTIGPVSGNAFFYTSPVRMSDGLTTLYFTSVSDVSFSVQRRPGGGQPGVVSASPNAAFVSPNTPTLFTFVISDTAGARDLQGLNILFSDPPLSVDVPQPFVNYDPYACWIWYQRSTNTLSLFVHDAIDLLRGGWVSSQPGVSGNVLTGPRCVIDTTMATERESGNFLTLTLPISLPNAGVQQFYPATMPITMRAVNNENVDTGYQQAGHVTVNPTAGPGFIIYTTPTIQDVALGSSATFKLNVVSWGGFNDVITFAAAIPMDDPKYTYDPPAITGSGATTLTVSTDPLAGKPYPGPTGGVYLITVSGKSSSMEFDRAVLMAVESGPPTISATDSSPVGGSDHHYHFTVSDPPLSTTGRTAINGFNALIGPALDGRNACWLFSDGRNIWLAGDDGLTWSLAGPGFATPVGNSQCAVEDFGVNPYTDWNIEAHIVFKPGFSAMNNKMFVRASNLAGFDTGYTLADVR